MTLKNILTSGLGLVLSIANTLLGTAVAIFMMAGDFLNELAGVTEQTSRTGFELFFLNYILHPATGIVYICIFAGLLVYQNNIPNSNCRISAHIALLALSCLILLQSVLLIYR